MKNKQTNQPNKLVIFQSKKIRRIWNEGEWNYSVVDIAGTLTDSSNPTDYLKKIRKRDKELGIYIGTNCPQIAIQNSVVPNLGTVEIECQLKLEE